MLQKVSLIVPVYKKLTELEIISFERLLKIFEHYCIVIICPVSFNIKVIEHRTKNNIVHYEFFSDSYFKSTRTYNQLLMSKIFYERFFLYDYILICQLDVYVFKDNLSYWIDKKYDNIGAPIFEKHLKITLTMKLLGNNGGFCLRNVKSCLKVLNSIKIIYSPISLLWKMESVWYWKLFRLLRDGLIFNYHWHPLTPLINEDIFWSIIVPQRFPWFRNCPSGISMYFAFDANPHFLFEMCGKTYPMAIHAWWQRDKSFVETLINNFNEK
jgi:hypothetical protein